MQKMNPRINFKNPERITLFAKYTAMLRTDRGIEVRERFRSDIRIQTNEGQMIQTGEGEGRLSIDILAMWYLWCEDTLSRSEADQYLESFLSRKPDEMLIAVWILGVDIDKEYILSERLNIVPLHQMPPSHDREEFNTVYIDEPSRRTTPGAALTRRFSLTRISKAVSSDTIDRSASIHTQAYADIELMSFVANLIPGICCLPFHSTTYSVDSNIPCGPFGGYYSGTRHHDAIPRSRSPLTTANIEQWVQLFESTKRLVSDSQARLLPILKRLARSKCYQNIDDQILDLSIACEMALLEGKNLDQLSLSFRLRGAWLLGGNLENRIKNLDSLKCLYKLRSEVAHTGLLSEKGRSQAKARINEFERIACEIIVTLIKTGFGMVDWERCILGDRIIG